MNAFFVSFVLGVLFPLVPIFAEFGLASAATHFTIDSGAAPITGVVYTAAAGMGSRYQSVAVASYFFATICAIIFGARKIIREGEMDAPFIMYSQHISFAVIMLFTFLYVVERFGRHWVDNEPFLEF